MELGDGNLETTLERADVFTTLATSGAHKLSAVGAAGSDDSPEVAGIGRGSQRGRGKGRGGHGRGRVSANQNQKTDNSSGAKANTPLPKKLEAIIDFPTPQRANTLLGFLGAVNYYRRCLGKVDMKHPAEILQPLYQAATKKIPGKSFQKLWQENKLEGNFILVKRMLMQACQLVHPDPNTPLALTTDASKMAIGAVLEQFSEGQWIPLGFWSRHLRESQCKLSTFRRELY